MKKFEGMLFCTDLDGTLYASDKTVSRENLDAIEYFKAEGGLFTFITGRVPLTSTHVCQTIRPNAPFGCMNGAALYDPQKECYLWNLSLAPEALELVRAVDEQFDDIGIQLNTKDQIYFCKESRGTAWFRKVTGVPGESRPYDAVPEPVLKVVFSLDDPNQIDALKHVLHNHPKAHLFDFIRSERTLYEILPKGADKGLALCKMTELLGIDPAKTIAVGDYDNDVAMVRQAGLGFSVANAVDSLKSVAKYVTVHHNEHAIAAIVDGLDCGKFQI